MTAPMRRPTPSLRLRLRPLALVLLGAAATFAELGEPDVAAAVGRSPTYVTSALTRATGRSAGEWIVRGRMAEARRLLLHSDEMVDAISGRVGYADPTHFIRMFRREHGATPAAWRAAQPRSSQAPADAPVTARRAPRAPSSARR